MHDRRIDGVVHTFGNEGALFMNAMTWWDHETLSIWSQPWGAAIEGELLGTRLTLVPFDLLPWSVWLERHPETKVLVDERANLSFVGRLPHDRFVIGVSIGEHATGFHFRSVANAGVVNEQVGDFPVAVFADGETREIDAYLRNVAGEKVDEAGITGPLTFEVTFDGAIIDEETGSSWDIRLGVSTDGPLRGTVIQRAPYISSFDWAWRDFFPQTDFWGSRNDAEVGGTVRSKLD